ncbi:MAG: hypothetical protein U9O89_05565, partial [Thermoproteota archaeon]|nr:hypothetical protein [Thermoproteota archaeon]
KKQEIPYNIKAFACAIEKIFGLGANYVEILILKRLYKKIGRSFKGSISKDQAFTEYVAAANRIFLWKKKTEKIVEEVVPCEEVTMEG